MYSYKGIDFDFAYSVVKLSTVLEGRRHLNDIYAIQSLAKVSL